MFPIVSKIISREEWGAREPKRRKEQKVPVGHMVVTWTNTKPCMNKEECIKAVRKQQKKDMEEGEPDIRANFLVGGDGYLYEGRGWKTASSYTVKCLEAEQFQDDSIQLAFINKPTNKPTYVMLKAVATIFALGEENKYLVKNVKYSRIVDNEVMSFTI